MGAGVEQIHEKIKAFRRKYYLNIFIRGAILSLSILTSYFLIATLIEYNLWLSPWARFLIFFTFFAVAIFCTYRFLKEPLSWWIVKRGLDEEQSAKIIGTHLPSVNDRLLNLIQLQSAKSDSALIYASIEQKSQDFAPIQFDTFIDIRENKKYLTYLVLPFVAIFAIIIFNSSILTLSTQRIVNFTQQYSPQAPFKFLVSEKSLTAFYNEDLPVTLTLDGQAIPEDAYIISGNQRIKLDHKGNGEFVYTFENVQAEFDFQIEAAGFFSEVFHVSLINRPELTQFNVELEYPRYLQRQPEKIINSGNLEIPEGTKVHWNLSTVNAEKASILFLSDNISNAFQSPDNQSFNFQKEFRNPDQYEILLENDKSKNREKISYRVDVVKDQYPQISVNNFKDSILYQRVVLGGSLADDYGITQLALHFRIRNENQKEILSRSINIPISKGQNQQSFFYNWSVDSLKLNPGEQLEYYLQVWDNDGVNGRKSTKTGYYTFLLPSKDNLVTEINNSQSQTEQKINQSETKANKLQDQIEQAHQKLKGKQNLDWQDKKMLDDIIQQKQSLDQMLEQMKEENKMLEQKKEAFTKQDERIREKAEQIQKLMNELLDEETKKLFEELQKLLKENADVSKLQKVLDKLNQNTNNLEKELERTLELFKQLQYDYKLDQTIEDLKKQVKDQKSLLEKTESLEKDKSGKDQKGENNKDQQKNEGGKDQPNNENSKDQQKGENQKSESQKLAQEQEKQNEEFKKTSEKIEDLKKLGEELDKNEELPSQEDTEETQQEQEESKEMLEQNQPSKSKTPQQKSIQKMEKMQQQMEGAQSAMEMEMDMENMESLRQVIHGLVKLSFDQENLMKNLAELNQSDPRFNTLAQQQLKLKDDARVLEDSLLALGKRDPFMGSVVTKEVGELNDHLDKVIEANRERKRPQASTEMQASMTSINNLALLLDDHFDMMMQMMANAKPSMGKSKKKGQKPSLSQMQQQLNQKIQELKGSGKSGRQLSEELAEMAAEQERIRKALQEMQEKMKEGGKAPGGDLPAKMEQTEMDLVNKQLTDQLIRRQQDILTRMLETEKSQREQDMDEERKGETAKDYDKEMPKAFEEYLRLKEKEVELLKTVPPKLYPYYKKEVGEYFKRMSNQ
ncbi:DUF4175 family protein [Ohtaekwangia koreensis]|uniref:Uncharacterized protein n=1 Tax=Ohtaekwangia koreensis TaxID=688867 RepID=A0A1T5LG03_9BACT|nr:DUF4175 family protein [Ohtaekwangia koreensis]SKC74890.1 hypothetical protein SAMN05660236_3154 [Ohtaekwangia koreensis]